MTSVPTRPAAGRLSGHDAGRVAPCVAHDHLVVKTRTTRVMVALEQQLFAEVLRVALTDRGGYDVVNGGTSLADLRGAAERMRPDVVITAVESSRCDGLAALRELRAALPKIAVLVLDAVPSPQLLAEVMAVGAAGFLSLEADMAEVIRAVRQAADGQVVLSGRRLEELVRHLAQRSAPTAPSGPGGRLTEREHEVLLLLAGGASTPAIAASMYISPHTARTHVQNLLAKLGVHSRLEAATYAVRHGLVPSS